MYNNDDEANFIEEFNADEWPRRGSDGAIMPRESTDDDYDVPAVTPDLLRQFEIFLDLSDEDLHPLVTAGRARRYQRGKLIAGPDEAERTVVLVLAGEVGFYHSDRAGHILAVETAGPREPL